jgi:single-strand DNA-binding protein
VSILAWCGTVRTREGRKVNTVATSLNKVQLIGNVGKDPELRYLASGTPLLQFSVATSSYRKDESQESGYKEETEWHNIGMFGDAAERLSAQFEKGAKVYIEGKIKTRNWTDDQGQKHYRTEVLADQLIVLGGKKTSGGQGSGSYQRGGSKGGDWPTSVPGKVALDDLPFE